VNLGTAKEHDPDDHDCEYKGNDAWSCGHIDNAECCDGGDWNGDSREYRYFDASFNYVDKHGKPADGLTAEEVRKYVRQDYERMERLNAGDWAFIGIKAKAEVSIDNVVQSIHSGGLWGIESDSERSYIKEIENEQLAELRNQLYAMGFGKRAIAAACKNVERTEAA
jgi:hypothetical protein